MPTTLSPQNRYVSLSDQSCIGSQQPLSQIASETYDMFCFVWNALASHLLFLSLNSTFPQLVNALRLSSTGEGSPLAFGEEALMLD